MFNNSNMQQQFNAEKAMYGQFCPQGGYPSYTNFGSAQLAQVSQSFGGGLTPSSSGALGGQGTYIGMSGGMIMSGNSSGVGHGSFT